MVGLFIWSILMIFIGICVGYVIGLVTKQLKETAYEQGIKNFVEWYDKHENKEGFPYTVGNIKTHLSAEGILREFNIAMDNQINRKIQESD